MNGTFDKHSFANTAHNTGGNAGKSLPQQPIAGPENPGPPEAMRKALARKSGTSTTGSGPGLPNRNTTFAGTVR
jgi:hypothetical protein